MHNECIDNCACILYCVPISKVTSPHQCRSLGGPRCLGLGVSSSSLVRGVGVAVSTCFLLVVLRAGDIRNFTGLWTFIASFSLERWRSAWLCEAERVWLPAVPDLVLSVFEVRSEVLAREGVERRWSRKALPRPAWRDWSGYGEVRCTNGVVRAPTNKKWTRCQRIVIIFIRSIAQVHVNIHTRAHWERTNPVAIAGSPVVSTAASAAGFSFAWRVSAPGSIDSVRRGYDVGWWRTRLLSARVRTTLHWRVSASCWSTLKPTIKRTSLATRNNYKIPTRFWSACSVIPILVMMEVAYMQFSQSFTHWTHPLPQNAL